MKRLTKFVIMGLVIITAIGIVTTAIFVGFTKPDEENGYKKNYMYSFENGLSDWASNGTDLDAPPINWSIDKTDNVSYSGESSVRYYIENFNDAGKIWLEKMFDLKKNTLYDVKVSFKFGTSDFGEFNLFNIITTIRNSPISGRDDLVYREDTGHHSDSQDLVWLNKTYSSLVQTDSDGKIYINIGIWGSWETTRTYCFDDLNISFNEVEPIENYPNLSGNWTLTNYDFKGNVTSIQNVTITQESGEITIDFEMGIPCSGFITRNTLKNPLEDTEFIVKGCDFGGLGINSIFIIDENNMKTEMPACETCNPAVFTR